MTSRVTIEAINDDVEFRILPETKGPVVDATVFDHHQANWVLKGNTRELLIHSGRSILIREAKRVSA